METERRVPAPPLTQVARYQMTIRIPQVIYDEVVRSLENESVNGYIVEAVKQRLKAERGWSLEDPAPAEVAHSNAS